MGAEIMFHHTRQTLKHDVALNLRRLRYGRPQAKVFCVGFQKTGTTSLQYALSLIGYRVAGIIDANPYDTPETLHAEALRLLPQFDAFADNPWPTYFREFDVILGVTEDPRFEGLTSKRASTEVSA